MTKRLSLDLGTNSIGWCLFNLNDKEPVSIQRMGARIFSDGRDSKSLTSLKATRREARSASRRRDRFIQRKKYLIDALVKNELMPSSLEERQKLAFKDPYPIRKRALDEELHPYEMGRALFHLNQRRGFKSNRKSNRQDNEAGIVKQSIAKLETKLMLKNAKTIGAFFADRHDKNETVRARRYGTTLSDLYEFYPDRAMLEKEFDLIWEKQADFNPKLYTEERKGTFKKIIFTQRPLKPQEVGKCTFLPDEYRIAKALPSFQRFRIYQELANLCWLDRQGKSHRVIKIPSLRDSLFENLEKQKKLTFKRMRIILKKAGIIDYDAQFNLESERRKHLDGNETSCIMRKEDMMGAVWDDLAAEEQDALILLLEDDLKDEEVKRELKSSYGLSGEVAEKLLDAEFPSGHGTLSKKAIDKILPIMVDQGLEYYKAVDEAGLGAANLYNPDAPLQNKLDYYGKALSGHVLNASGKVEDSDEQRYGIITNPTVHIALNQIRAVVNELIRLHGKPDEIVLEIARDLPMGKQGKEDIKKQQKDNYDRNERIREELKKYNITDSRTNRQKYQLWEELSPDPASRRCPFSGEMISLEGVFDSKVEIEHLLPYSKTLDDSMANKTLSMREANKAKGNRSPFEAFGASPEWEAILEKSKHLPHRKQWRFLPDAMEKFEEEGGFLERHINDTRYISRYTSQYLATIVPKNNIWVVTGRLTAMLRHRWGLNSVLRGHNTEEEETVKKNREDHRHHAVDAVVIGMISRSILQFVSKAARRSEERDLPSLFEGSIDPWEGFRDEVKRHVNNIIVSHRPRKKSQGALHNETAYGLIEHNANGASRVVHKVPIETLEKKADIEKIRDPLIRSQLGAATADTSGQEFKEAVSAYCAEKTIRSLRIEEKMSVIPIYDKNGTPYKGYKGDGNAYMDIFEHPQTKKWQAEIVSRFDANNKKFRPHWQSEYPALPLKMRLRINDLIIMDDGDRRVIYRVQKMTSGRLILAPHVEANVDARNRDKNNPFNSRGISASGLQKNKARRVHISPTGLIQEEKISEG